MNTLNDETININYREKVPCFGNNPSADIKLMQAINEEHDHSVAHMLCSIIVFGIPSIASIIAIVCFLCSL